MDGEMTKCWEFWLATYNYVTNNPVTFPYLLRVKCQLACAGVRLRSQYCIGSIKVTWWGGTAKISQMRVESQRKKWNMYRTCTAHTTHLPHLRWLLAQGNQRRRAQVRILLFGSDRQNTSQCLVLTCMEEVGSGSSSVTRASAAGGTFGSVRSVHPFGYLERYVRQCETIRNKSPTLRDG